MCARQMRIGILCPPRAAATIEIGAVQRGGGYESGAAISRAMTLWTSSNAESHAVTQWAWARGASIRSSRWPLPLMRDRYRASVTWQRRRCSKATMRSSAVGLSGSISSASASSTWLPAVVGGWAGRAVGMSFSDRGLRSRVTRVCQLGS
jgi:hypothetical protein